jgi:hypothetical protein
MNRLPRRGLLAALAGLFLLASCAPPPQAVTLPDLRFTELPPLMLQANQIEIRTLAQPGSSDALYPVPPVRAMQNWARDRLRASGQGGPARFTIAAADAVVKDLPLQSGFSATFTDQVSQEYDVAVDASIEILDERGLALRSVRVALARSRTVLQSATAADRERARYELVRDLMADFNARAEQQIAGNFGAYLLSH